MGVREPLHLDKCGAEYSEHQLQIWLKAKQDFNYVGWVLLGLATYVARSQRQYSFYRMHRLQMVLPGIYSNSCCWRQIQQKHVLNHVFDN